jgi:hypothetical protein
VTPSPLIILLLCVSAAIFFLAWAFKWLIVPLMLARKQGAVARPKFELVTPERLTPEARDFVGAIVREFAVQGFEVAAYVSNDKAIKGVSSTSMLLVNRRSGDVANVITTRAKLVRGMVFTIRSHFSDDRSIQTAFNRNIGFLPKNPEVDSMAVSWTRDVATLVELHRRRIAKAGRSNESRVTPTAGDEMRYMEQDWDKGISLFLRSGYYRRDGTSGEVRRTLKGSYLATWKLMEPIKSMRIRRRDREARRIWHELGMDDWHAPAAMATPTAAVAANRAEPPDDAGLRYEAQLAVGESRRERTPGSLTIRIGMPSRMAALAARWSTLLALLCFSSILVLDLWYSWWIQYSLAVRFPGYRPRAPVLSFWFFLLALFVVRDVYRIVRTLVLTRGTIVLTASPAGLAYQNIPSWTPTGMIPREDVATLVVLHVTGLFRKEYQLRLRRHGVARAIILFAGRDRPMMQRLRTDLAVALGIENAHEGLEALHDDAAAIPAAAGNAGGSAR